MRTSLWKARGLGRSPLVAGLVLLAPLAGCSGILDVQYPGRIPAEQINDPALA